MNEDIITVTLEVSRVPAGVATTWVPEAFFEHDEKWAAGISLIRIHDASQQYHHRQMVPSINPADYKIHRHTEKQIRLYLRHNHPWWDEEVAHMVAKRSKRPHEEWKLAHQIAAQQGKTVLEIVIHPVETDYGPFISTR